IIQVMDRFWLSPSVRQATKEHELTEKIFLKAVNSFREMCMDVSLLDPELVEILRDIARGKSKDVDQLFPFFLSHARRVFPHLESMEELKNV
ncbi:hypothetical protein PMAYCL1PPCAC_01754, partial [Pristionchus mayeri]